MSELSVSELHQLKIAKKTLTLPCVGCLVLGGPNHSQAIEIIAKLTASGIS